MLIPSYAGRDKKKFNFNFIKTFERYRGIREGRNCIRLRRNDYINFWYDNELLDIGMGMEGPIKSPVVVQSQQRSCVKRFPGLQVYRSPVEGLGTHRLGSLPPSPQISDV